MTVYPQHLGHRSVIEIVVLSHMPQMDLQNIGAGTSWYKGSDMFTQNLEFIRFRTAEQVNRWLSSG